MDRNKQKKVKNMEEKLYQVFVQGYTWKARMSNGAVFEIWTPKDISRKEAKKLMIEEANRCCPDKPAYDRRDIEALWKTKR